MLEGNNDTHMSPAHAHANGALMMSSLPPPQPYAHNIYCTTQPLSPDFMSSPVYAVQNPALNH